jgi:hypothetical protein
LTYGGVFFYRREYLRWAGGRRSWDVRDFFNVVVGAEGADDFFLGALRGAAVDETTLEFQVPHNIEILAVTVPGVGHPAAVEHLGTCMVIFDSVS